MELTNQTIMKIKVLKLGHGGHQKTKRYFQRFSGGFESDFQGHFRGNSHFLDD